MSVTEKTTHSADALARLIEQFKNNPQMREMIRTWADQVQALETVAFQIINGRGIDLAVGAQLDGIGQIVGQARNGADDTTYRLRLKARILLNLSSGTLPQILDLFTLLVPTATDLDLREYYPASFRLEVCGAVSDASATELQKILQAARPAGVGAKLITSSVAKSATFTYDGIGATQGYDAGQYARIG